MIFKGINSIAVGINGGDNAAGENPASSYALAGRKGNSADSGGHITCEQCGRSFPLSYAVKGSGAGKDCHGFAWANYRRHIKTHDTAQPNLINED